MPDQRRELRINGIMLQNRLQNVGIMAGRAVQERVRDALPAELAEAYRYSHIVAGGWYPIGWLRTLHEAIDAAAGQQPDFPRRLGFFGTRQNFRGVHKAFLRVLSPGAVIERSTRIFRTYYDGGQMTAVQREPRLAIARWGECAGFNRNLWQATFGSCEAALEMCRGQSIRVEVTAGGGDAQDFAEIAVSWK